MKASKHCSTEESCTPALLPSQDPLSIAPLGQPPNMTPTFPEVDSTSAGHHPRSLFMDISESTPLPWSSDSDAALTPHELDHPNYHISLRYGDCPTALFNYPDHCAHNGLPYEDYHLCPPLDVEPSCPRTYASQFDLVNSVGNMNDAYPPSAYLLEPQKPLDTAGLSTDLDPGQEYQTGKGYEGLSHCTVKSEHSQNYELPHYEAEYDTATSVCSHDCYSSPNGPNEPNSSHAAEENSADKEQPYAQLIYRALLQAPDHTMVLRDIYNWFRSNTDKAVDKDTKGWQNSIRHNLSMNGAFEKVDQPSDDTKKGFMWRLTESAIRDGVKSTTRYRSKLPNKRGYRSAHPAPQRQASGAKGGHAARKAAHQRRSERLNRSRPALLRDPDHVEVYIDHPGPTYFSRVQPEVPASYPSSPYYSTQSDFDSISYRPKFEPLSAPHSYPNSPTEPSYCEPMYMLPSTMNEPLFYDSGSPVSNDGAETIDGTGPLTPVTPPFSAADGVLDKQSGMEPSMGINADMDPYQYADTMLPYNKY